MTINDFETIINILDEAGLSGITTNPGDTYRQVEINGRTITLHKRSDVPSIGPVIPAPVANHSETPQPTPNNSPNQRDEFDALMAVDFPADSQQVEHWLQCIRREEDNYKRGIPRNLEAHRHYAMHVFYQFPDEWISAQGILYGVADPGPVIRPLVKRGLVERKGVAASARYRLVQRGRENAA